MARYLISFPSDAMNHIPAEDLPAVGDAAGAVVQEAMDAGVWVFGGGLAETVDPGHGGRRRDDHHRHVPADQGFQRRVHGHRHALT
jgi:hypothetical protein